ncbi:carboxymuconolactone decarboxylase family protein [Frateuria edaphi]|uniref:carboxymuconolactone decarboxylase family protein n=1 Tax=Frateuria edaphi TaxID=2898793 RepID=UPI001E598321|nr:carboxymuconolactone decarboxylase family protein [Frateuria edaphi]UGB46292.1 carboxymuconolactone decarboxylase family protein [Frateuria edaphi]
MSRIAIHPLESAAGAAAAVYARITQAVGRVPNCFAAIGQLRPAALKAMLQLDGVLAAGSLSRQDQETVKLVVSETAGCDYCITAHSLLGALTGLEPPMLRRIRNGLRTGDVRRDALVRFVRQLVQSRGTLDEAEVIAIRAAGFSDAQLVEISLAVAVATFTNTFNRINDTEIDLPSVD